MVGRAVAFDAQQEVSFAVWVFHGDVDEEAVDTDLRLALVAVLGERIHNGDFKVAVRGFMGNDILMQMSFFAVVEEGTQGTQAFFCCRR